MGRSSLIAELFMVVAVINLHHFIVDAYIWRIRRDRNYDTVMSARPAAPG